MSSAPIAATLTARRSTRFVAWVRAWRAGLVPFDELAGEIAGDEEHLVADAPGTWTLQLVLDQGAWEEVLTVDADDADNLQDMLSAASVVHYDIRRRTLMFGTTPVGSA